jgi:dolichyl-phosphate-mannose-protein mannosyltransferase
MPGAKTAVEPHRGSVVSGASTTIPRIERAVVAGALRRNPATAIFLSALLAFIVVTRWLTAPEYLYYFDSANFALSLENFNPSLHQPQPPGYPLFVALIRIIHLFANSAQDTMVIAGLVGACAATVLIYFLASDLFGRAAGILAAALLASNPVFWFGGVSNQIRVFLAVSSVGVSLLAWRALTAPRRDLWMAATFAALGIAAGFRPAEAMLLLPLVAWVWWRGGPSLRRLPQVLMLAATSLPWIAATVYAGGGWAHMLDVMRNYSDSQFQGSSWFYGAPLASAWRMLRLDIAWHLYGPVAWIWALILIPKPRLTGERLTKAIFLALAFLPYFLFCGFIHIGDPDQALGGIAILCVAGGAVLAKALERLRIRRVLAAATVMVALHCALFLFPPFHAARAASYRFVRDIDHLTSTAIDAIAELNRDGPLTIVHWGTSVTSRQIEYYFPDAYVDVLPGSPSQAAPGEGPMAFYRHATLSIPNGASGRIHPGTRHVICLIPAKDAAALRGWRQVGPLFVLDSVPEQGIELHGQRIVW